MNLNYSRDVHCPKRNLQSCTWEERGKKVAGRRYVPCDECLVTGRVYCMYCMSERRNLVLSLYCPELQLSWHFWLILIFAGALLVIRRICWCWMSAVSEVITKPVSTKAQNEYFCDNENTYVTFTCLFLVLCWVVCLTVSSFSFGHIFTLNIGIVRWDNSHQASHKQ